MAEARPKKMPGVEIGARLQDPKVQSRIAMDPLKDMLQVDPSDSGMT